MTENPNLEKRLSELERRHDRTRDALSGFIAITQASTAVYWLNPDRTITAIIDTVIAYAIIKKMTVRMLYLFDRSER